jgi:rare lipoprotein A (peptidoglycan hydrolase)
MNEYNSVLGIFKAFLKKLFNVWSFVLAILIVSLSINSIGTPSSSAEDLDPEIQRYLDEIDEKIERMGLEKTGKIFKSRASWYGADFHGRTTANMEIYNKDLLSVAHKSLPINTYILVTNLENKKQLILRVNDRGPYVEGRDLDLSEGAAKQIGSYHKGVIPVNYEILNKTLS